jgi:hypothetical protein
MMKGNATTILYPLSSTRRLSHMSIILSLIDLKLAIKKKKVELTSKLSGFGVCQYLLSRKALPGFFLCIFSSLAYLKKPVFSKRDLLWVESTRRLYWDRLTSGRYQPTYHYFKKVKKSQLCFNVRKKKKEFRPFREF